MKILVIGSINMDLVTYMPHLPKEGETLLGTSFMQNPGGKGANQACAAGLLGADVTFLGAVGKDEHADSLRKILLDCKVKPVLKVVNHVRTGIASILIEEETHDNRIIVVPGANHQLLKEDIDQNIQLLKACDIIVTQLEIPISTVEYIAKKAEEFHKVLILNPAPAYSLSPEVFKSVTYFTPNETELGFYANMEIHDEISLEKATKILHKKGVKNLLVTLGSKGVYWSNGNHAKLIPAFKVQAVDTTAAGDCFNGVFATFLEEGYSEEEAIFLAEKASSIAVQRKGAIPSLPTKSEVFN